MTNAQKIEHHQRLLRTYGGIDNLRMATQILDNTKEAILGLVLEDRVPNLSWEMVQFLMNKNKLVQCGPGAPGPDKVYVNAAS